MTTEQVETELAPKGETAWSAVDYPPTDWGMLPVQDRFSWWRLVLGIVVPGVVVVAGIIGALVVVSSRPVAPVAQPTTAPVASPPPTPPPPVGDRFIAFLNAVLPIGKHIEGPTPIAIKEANWVCDNLANGHSQDETIASMDTAPLSGGTADMRHGINEAGLYAAIVTYCPQFNRPTTRDTAFIAVLNADGAGVINDAVGVEDAQKVCHYSGNGMTRANVVDWTLRTVSGYSQEQAERFVTASTNFYCPG